MRSRSATAAVCLAFALTWSAVPAARAEDVGSPSTANAVPAAIATRRSRRSRRIPRSGRPSAPPRPGTRRCRSRNGAWSWMRGSAGASPGRRTLRRCRVVMHGRTRPVVVERDLPHPAALGHLCAVSRRLLQVRGDVPRRRRRGERSAADDDRRRRLQLRRGVLVSRQSLGREGIDPYRRHGVAPADLAKLRDDLTKFQRAFPSTVVVRDADIRKGGFFGIGRQDLAATLERRGGDKVARITKTLDAGRLSGADLARAYCERALANVALERRSDALADADRRSRSIRTRPRHSSVAARSGSTRRGVIQAAGPTHRSAARRAR